MLQLQYNGQNPIKLARHILEFEILKIFAFLAFFFSFSFVTVTWHFSRQCLISGPQISKWDKDGQNYYCSTFSFRTLPGECQKQLLLCGVKSEIPQGTKGRRLVVNAYCSIFEVYLQFKCVTFNLLVLISDCLIFRK